MTAARWRDLLGEELAARVANLNVTDPARWCRATVLAAVEKAEGRPPTNPANKRQMTCPHPEKDRVYGRCGKCGLRGLPHILKAKETK